MASWEPVDMYRDDIGEEYDKWDDVLTNNLERRFNRLRRLMEL